MAKRTPAQKRWQDEHYDYLLQQRRAYVAQHREEIQAYQRRWRAAHRDLNRLYRKVGVANRIYPEKLSIHDLRAVLEASDYKCHWCGKENLTGRDLTLEHLQPINRREFLAVACHSCNSARVAQLKERPTPEELRERQRLASQQYAARNRERIRENHRRYQRSERERVRAERLELAALKKRHGDE